MQCYDYPKDIFPILLGVVIYIFYEKEKIWDPLESFFVSTLFVPELLLVIPAKTTFMRVEGLSWLVLRRWQFYFHVQFPVHV